MWKQKEGPAQLKDFFSMFYIDKKFLSNITGYYLLTRIFGSNPDQNTKLVQIS